MGLVFRSPEHVVVNASTMVEHLIHDPKVHGLNLTYGRGKEKSMIILNDMKQKGVQALGLLSCISYCYLKSPCDQS